MGVKTPAGGMEEKPDVKAAGNKPSFQHHGPSNNNQQRDNYLKRKKFLRADPKLSGKVFKAKRN